jgi:hypothetical protein
VITHKYNCLNPGCTEAHEELIDPAEAVVEDTTSLSIVPLLLLTIFSALVISLALVLTSGPAKSESLGFRNPVVAVQKVASCANVMLAVQLTDAYTTRRIVQSGGYERDPLAKPLVSSNIGAYGSAALLNILARSLTRHTPWVMCAVAGVESLAVVNNFIVLGRGRP